MLTVRLTSKNAVEIRSGDSPVTGIKVHAGEGVVLVDGSDELPPRESRIVAQISQGLPVRNRRVVTIEWDGALGRERTEIGWP